LIRNVTTDATGKLDLNIFGSPPVLFIHLVKCASPILPAVDGNARLGDTGRIHIRERLVRAACHGMRGLASHGQSEPVVQRIDQFGALNQWRSRSLQVHATVAALGDGSQIDGTDKILVDGGRHDVLL
jgi:hypothetical protein